MWCGKHWINNCGPYYTEPVFGIKRFERKEKNTSWFQKQNDKKTFEDFLKEAVKKIIYNREEALMNKQIDKLFSQIEYLKWLPWICENYFSSSAKLMILGESHYLCEGYSQENYGKDFTRSFVAQHKNEGVGTKVFRNFEKTILNRDTDEELSKTEQWDIIDSIVYQVIVQRLLESNDERPSAGDFKNGWKIIFKTMKVLKPKVVISLGVESSNFLACLEYDGLVVKKEKWKDEKINNAYP